MIKSEYKKEHIYMLLQTAGSPAVFLFKNPDLHIELGQCNQIPDRLYY